MPSPYQRRQTKRQLELQGRAQEHRRHPTLSEARLWEALRGGRLGVTFRRQVVIGRFIADFASSEARLVIEVDGGVHLGRARLDRRRDALLGCAGYRVVRLHAELVIHDLHAAVAIVRQAVGA